MRTRSLLAFLVAAVLFSACGSSTKVVSSWRDPDTRLQQGHFKKLLCIALLKDESNRRVAEDKLAALTVNRGVPSYRYLGPLPDSLDAQETTARLVKDGFDGIVIMRLVRKEKEVSYVPGAYPATYYSPWGYYGYAQPYYADPGYVRTDDYYFVETNLYDLAQGKLIWSGMTSTWEPSNVESAVQEVVDAVYRKMKSEDFIEEPAKP